MGSTYVSRNAASREVSFYNYKKYLSIILFAMVDAHTDEPLEGDDIDMPYFVIGDGAFDDFYAKYFKRRTKKRKII